MYLQYTPSSKRNLYSKIIDKSEAVYFFSCFLKRNLTVSKEIRINDSIVTRIAVLNVLDADSEKTLKLCADGNLQQRRHVGWKKSCPVVLCEVFGVDEVAVAYSAGVFFAEGVQRGVGLVAGRLHLDGAELCAP